MTASRTIFARRALFALALASGASVMLAATPTEAMPGYDGVWSVSIVTEKGDCDRGYRYPIRITHGQLLNAGEAPVTITGKVAPSGAIRVLVSHGSSSAHGSGHLAGNLGSGSWTGGTCSGSWTAERRGS
jgi:hypothetical protein